MPWVRAVATRSAKPTLASQAENASRSKGEVEKLVEFSWRVQRERARNRESIMLSRHKRAESRWERWNARPAKPRINVAENVKWMGDIKQIWTLTKIF